MRRFGLLAALATAGAVAVLAWAILAERGHEEGKARALHSFGPIELRAKPMAKTQVPGENLSASFTFRQAIWPEMGGAGGYQLQYVWVSTPLAGFRFSGLFDNPSHPGQWGLEMWATDVLPPQLVVLNWYETPTDPEDIYWVEVPCSIVMSGNAATKLTHSTVPIGEKGATHAKECVLTEEWFVPAGTQVTANIGASSATWTTSADITAALSMNVCGNGIDADDWSSYLVGTKYAMSIENICFGPVAIDTSSFTARTWGGTPASENKLWVEGFGRNSIGFWCSEAFYNGPYVYNDYPGGNISAPLSYDFGECYVRAMDGRDIPEAIVYCTGLRQIVNGTVIDAPWKGTIGELRGLGRYTQKHGCYYWDTQMADMLPTVEMYLSLENEALDV